MTTLDEQSHNLERAVCSISPASHFFSNQSKCNCTMGHVSNLLLCAILPLLGYTKVFNNLVLGAASYNAVSLHQLVREVGSRANIS